MTVHATSLLPAIIALPLVAAVAIGLFGRRLSRNVVHAMSIGVMSVAFTLSLRAFYAMAQVAESNADNPQIVFNAWTWAVSGIFQFDIAFCLDPMSAVLLLVVTGVGLLVHIFSTGYMRAESAYARYFFNLQLFVFAMLVLILGKSLFILFLGWQGISAASYLLVGDWFAEERSAQASQKSFIISRIGDAAFLVGLILILFHAGGTTDFNALKWTFISGEYGPFHDPYTLTAACILLFAGVCSKSAQLPFHVWLPDAMHGPTPAVALTYAAMTMVAVVYVIARLSFMYTMSPVAMGVVATIGAFTGLFAAVLALVQRDIKTALAYITMSQLGFALLAVGVGAYGAGIFYSITHAFFQVVLILAAGSVVRAMQHEQDVFRMGGLKAKMPITRATFLVACCAIAGFPFLSGYYSKGEVLWEVYSRGQALSLPENAHASYADVDGMLLGGRHGVVLSTAGDGHWSQSRLPVTVAQIRDVRQAVPSNVRGITRAPGGDYWAVSDHATLFRSADGGTWQRIYVPSAGPQPGFKAVAAVADDNVWAVGEQGWVVHFDGHAAKKIHVPTQSTLRAIATNSVGQVYVGGNGGTLLQWDGTEWTAIQSPTSATITDMARVQDTVWATTAQGQLLKLNSAGGFDKVAVKADGVQVQFLNGLARGSDTVIAMGRAIFGEEGPRAGVFQMNSNGTFTALAGRTDAVLHAGSVIGGMLYAHGDGKYMQQVTVEGTLTNSSVSTVLQKPALHRILWFISLLTGFLTAFCAFRLYFLAFEGVARSDQAIWTQVHEAPLSMTIPMAILATLAVVAGWWGEPLIDWLHPVFSIAHTRLEITSEPTWVAMAPLSALLGVVLAYISYGRVSSIPTVLIERFPRLHSAMTHSLYVNEGYEFLIVRPYARIAQFLYRVVDEFLIDLVVVRSVGFVIRHVGTAFALLRTIKFPAYAVYIAIGLILLALLVGV